jgi:hypothetical protein
VVKLPGKSAGRAPSLSYTLAFALQLRKKARKTLCIVYVQCTERIYWMRTKTTQRISIKSGTWKWGNLVKLSPPTTRRHSGARRGRRRCRAPMTLNLGWWRRWSTSRPSRFISGEERRYILKRRVEGSQSRSGRWEKKRIISFPLRRFEPVAYVMPVPGTVYRKLGTTFGSWPGGLLWPRCKWSSSQQHCCRSVCENDYGTTRKVLKNSINTSRCSIL